MLMKGDIHINVFLAATMLLIACRSNNSNPVATGADSSSVKTNTFDTSFQSGNTSILFSSDSSKLGRLLSFKYYKPVSVKFKYSFIDNSGSNNRIDVPGPSDNKLEAIMYFDSASFNSLMAEYKRADWPDPMYRKEEFNFNWLDAATKKELLQSDTIPHGYIDLFWTDPNDSRCHTWILNRKILLYRATD